MGSMSTEVQGHLGTGLWDVSSAKPLAKMVAFCGSSCPWHWIRAPHGGASENKLLNTAFQKRKGSSLHRVISSGRFGALTLKKN